MTVGAVLDAATGLRRYDTATPPDLVEMLDATVAARPDAAAFIDDAGTVTWRELDGLVAASAAGLRAAGLRRGDRVAVVAGNGLAFTSVYWGAWRAGLVVVPLNHRLTADDLARQVADSGAALLLVGHGKEALGLAAAAAAGVRHHHQAAARCFFEEVADDGVRTAVEPSTPAAILYTSGTTGAPKGVVVSHANAVQNSVTCVDVIGRRPDDRELVMAPQFNVTGLCSVTVPIVHLGMCGVLLDGFDAGRAVAAVRTHGVTSAVGAPTMWWRLLEAAGDEGLPSLRLALYGGAPMPVALLSRMREALPAASFGNGYGMTETCSMITYLGGDDATSRPESVGRPLPVTELRIVGSDGSEVPLGEVGEIVVRGPQVALGYWSADGVRPITDEQGWLRTGDAARLDHGVVVLADRLKDVIKRAGESVFSIEVEEVLYQHPDVLEAAVLGVPDDQLGEVVAAVVVAKPGRTVDTGSVVDHCKRHLARFKVPSLIRTAHELPRNAGGKVDKPALRQGFRA
jgi:acyl-CoA synthetase (AMP-forming)/AMP-acid ligase II